MRLSVTFVLVTLGLVGSGAKQDQAFKLTPQKQELIDLTNVERKKESIAALKPSPILCQAARDHAANMAKQKKLEHILDGKKPSDRIIEAGYKPALGGENVARVRGPLPAVMAGWMASKDHRKNILDPGFTEIGIGMAADEDGGFYYVQVLARPR